jgi:hypothetical protein
MCARPGWKWMEVKQGHARRCPAIQVVKSDVWQQHKTENRHNKKDRSTLKKVIVHL